MSDNDDELFDDLAALSGLGARAFLDFENSLNDSSGYSCDDDEVSTARLALLTDTGTICVECGASFTKPHGRVTACTYCWKRLTTEERVTVNRATHPEVNKEKHREEARARKARKAKKESK